MTKLYPILFLFILAGCNFQSYKNENAVSKQYQPAYAKYFKIEYTDNGKIISVGDIKNNKNIKQYFIGNDKKNPQQITNNVSKIICLSTSHLAAFNILKTPEKIKGIANENFVCNRDLIDILVEHHCLFLGSDFAPDIEKMIAIQPDIVFSDGEYSSSNLLFKKLESLGIPVVFCNDYKETHPLGRAEWLIFFAAFVNKETEAIKEFSIIKKAYLAEKNSIIKQQKQPTVFCNMPYQGIWYMPCKDNYSTQLITDAGGDFLWKNNTPTNGLNLQLSFEEVYLKASSANVWLNVNSCQSLNELYSINPKFALFQAYKNKNIFNVKVCDGGGIKLWEDGVFYPNKILHDYKIIMQNDSTQFDKLFYYKKLQ